jgi:23S rRNA (pseudouridine1915-N3)-methyltransferase
VGRLDQQLRPAFDHYRRLLAPRLSLEVREVREVALQGRAPAEVLKLEGERLLASARGADVLVALDRGGRTPGSVELAGLLGQWLERGRTAFVIGGSLGLAPEVTQAAGYTLSLSALTFPHQLARLVLAEQIWRAVKIRAGEAYHY